MAVMIVVSTLTTSKNIDKITHVLQATKAVSVSKLSQGATNCCVAPSVEALVMFTNNEVLVLFQSASLVLIGTRPTYVIYYVCHD